MPEFSYLAREASGESVRGSITASSASEAIVQLESDGLTVESIQLESVDAAGGKNPEDSESRPLAPQAQGNLDDYFDTALRRRQLIVPALRALAEEMPTGRGRSELRQLVRVLDDAQTVTDLRRSKLAAQWLPVLVGNLGEHATSKHLSDLIVRSSREAESRTQRRQLLAYPVSVLAITVVLVLLLCALVVPTFGTMLTDFGLRLPASTRWLLSITQQVTDHPIRTAFVIALGGIILYVIARLWMRFALATRLFGSVAAGNSMNLSAMSSFSGQLADLLEIKVALPDALWLSGQFCQHHFYQKAAEQLARDAHRGTQTLSDSSAARSFPGNVIYALQSDPHGDSSIALLRTLSEMYADRVHGRVDWTTGAIAQTAIVIIGILVGFVVVALFAPFNSMISGLS